MDHKYFRELTKRLSKLQEMVKNTPIPAELKSEVNVDKLQAVIRSVWVNIPGKRQFTPLVKQMTNEVIPIDSPLTKQEREYIKRTAEVLHKHYGDPIFKYDGKLGWDNVRVKSWQGLLRISPKVTAASSKRRYENFEKYLSGSTFRPDFKLLAQSIKLFLEMANMTPVNVDFEPAYVRSLFAAHTSNVGYPWYSKETKPYKDGKTYRDVSVEVTKQLNSKYGASWMVAIPALIIGRDQPGGLDFDMEKQWSYDQLLAWIDEANYKDSKARVVFAIDRLTNNNANPVLKAIIKSDRFLANPMFSAFLSREHRIPYYRRYLNLCTDNELTPINVDFSSFDTSISPELALIAIDIIESWITSDNLPTDFFAAIAAKTIYTKYTLYNPLEGRIEAGQKSKAIPSGIGWTGLIGLICAQISWTYGLIKYYGVDYIKNLISLAHKYQTFPQIGLGDDALGVVKSFSDLQPIADIIKDAFGMEISVQSTKTAVGVDFLQELFWDGKVYYPSGRAMTSALYSERAKGLGWAEWDMAFFSMLYNLRENPMSEVLACASIINAYDAAKLGIRDPKTQKAVSPKQFIKQLKKELLEHGDESAKQVLWDGDPSKENKFDDKGNFTGVYMKWTRWLAEQVNSSASQEMKGGKNGKN